MTDYNIEGEFDSDGTFHGTISKKGDGDAGGAGGLLTVIITYLLCLIGGIIMLTNVAREAPICIVPAVLAFVVMLIPIVIATGTGSFALNILLYLYKWSDVLIGLTISMFWILYVLEAVSTTVLYGMAIGLMYLTFITVIRILRKIGICGLIVSGTVAIVAYLVTLALSEDFVIGYLAMIPTVMTASSLLIYAVVDIFTSRRTGEKIGAAVKLVIYITVAACIFSLSGYTTQTKDDALQTSIDYINEGRYAEARQLLQSIKSDEAMELYASIRYKGIEVGEIIYNGHYKQSARSIGESGIAFICLDITDGKALLISLDVIGLNEQYSGIVSEDFMSDYSLDTDNISTSDVGKQTGKFFLLSKEQYENYTENSKLSEHLKKAAVSSVAKNAKKDVDGDNYKWTVAYTDYWLLNDFNGNDIGTVSVDTGEFKYRYNYKNYAGIRPCYYAVINK